MGLGMGSQGRAGIMRHMTNILNTFDIPYESLLMYQLSKRYTNAYLK